MQASADRAAFVETRVREGVAQAAAARAASRDAAACTQDYVYTARPDQASRRREAENTVRNGFDALQALLRTLPGDSGLRAQCGRAARQDRAVCGPGEERALALVRRGRRAQAQALWEARGTAARDRLDTQLDALSGGLEAYRARIVAAEERSRARTLAQGWVRQLLILLLSLALAVAVTRAVRAGVRDTLRARSDLGESEARYRLLFERSPQALWVYDRQTLRFLAVNEAAVRRYGYSREQFLTLTLLDIRAAGDREAALAAPGLPQQGDIWRHRTRAGDLLWVEVFSHPLVWEEQDAAMGIARDVTARLEAEDALKRAQEHLQTVVGNAPLILFSLDAEGVFTMSEGRGLASLGLAPGQVVGQSVFEVYADNPPLLADIRRALGGETVSCVFEVGGFSWASHCLPLRGADGRPQGVIGVAFDSTERHRAEEGLSRLAAIVQSSDDAIVARTLGGIVMTWNPGAERLYGWTAEEMIGRPLSHLFPPDRMEEGERITAAVTKGRRLEIAETVRRRKDGSLVDISFNSAPLHSADGTLIGASVISRDITAQKKAQAEAERASALTPLAGLHRPAHLPAQPRPLHGGAGRRHRPRPPLRPAVHGPGPVQARQRQPRPRRRRPSAPGGRDPLCRPSRRPRRPRRHPRPHGRRRVHPAPRARRRAPLRRGRRRRRRRPARQPRRPHPHRGPRAAHRRLGRRQPFPPTTARTPKPCSSTPTWRCTTPRPTGAGAGSPSRPP